MMRKPMTDKKKIARLVFVFDAKSGKLGAWVDSAKKALMMKGCALCTITHGILGEKSEWQDCKAQIGVPVDYFHRDDMPSPVAEVASKLLPCVVAQLEDGSHELLVGPDVLDRCKGSVADLKSRLFIRALAQNMDLPEVIIEA